MGNPSNGKRSKGPRRRAGGPGDPDQAAPPADRDEIPADTGGRPETGAREDFADEAALRPTGRDDDLDGDLDGGLDGGPEGTRASGTPAGDAGRDASAAIADRTVPSLDGSPIGPDAGAETGHPAAQHAADEHDDHHARSGFAATALKILIFVLVIFGLSLWLVPMVAPHLPAGLARILMPGQAELDQRLAALADRIEENTGQISADVAAMRGDIAGLSERLGTVEQTATAAQTESEVSRAAAEQSAAAAERNAVAGESVSRAEAAAREASGLADTATTAATEAGKVASAASRDTASLARRMTEFDARLATLSDQIDAVNENLAAGGADGEAAAPELAAAVASLQAEVEALSQQVGDSPELVTETEAQRFATQDDLRSARTALETEITRAVAALPPAQQIVVEDELARLRQNAEAAVQGVIDRVAALEATTTQVSETATAAERAATDAVGRVDEAIRQASLRSAAAALVSRLQNGLPYAGALAEAAELQGGPAPEALAAPAETGVATQAELLRSYGQAARNAMEADLEARAGDGLLAQASARVRSVVAGRPASEEPGDTVDAILSRVEARLREGDLKAALAEAEALPEQPQAAMSDWLADLRTRVAATEAATGWLGPGVSAATGAESGAGSEMDAGTTSGTTAGTGG
jgi:hypothetical protein